MPAARSRPAMRYIDAKNAFAQKRIETAHRTQNPACVICRAKGRFARITPRRTAISLRTPYFHPRNKSLDFADLRARWHRTVASLSLPRGAGRV